jgi:hypothetical protein
VKYINYLLLLVILALIINLDSPASASRPLSPNSTIRFAGPFENEFWQLGGSVIIDMNVAPTTIAGYINFTNDPDVGPLCGAGSFSGTRSGNNFQFSFTSSDSDEGCGVVYGTTFNVNGTFLEGNITNGQFYHPSSGQGGTFSANQTTRYTGTFSTNGYPGTVTIDLATNSTTQVTGYMNFTNNPGVGALCGAGSFRGSINSNNQMLYDFLSNDPDAGCGFDDGYEFAVSAILDNLVAITDGSYTVVDTGQTGTFSTACSGSNSTTNHNAVDLINGDFCPIDTEPPTGNIIWPYDDPNLPPEQYPKYGPNDTIRIEAIASDNFSGVKRVEFWLGYNGQWHRIKDEYFPPYEADFDIPNDLNSQVIHIGIHVVDKAGNVAIDPGELRYANYNESYGNPGVIENWIPAGNRSYLNQRALPEVVIYDPPEVKEFNGDWQCGGASVAMVLRMHDQIGGDYTTLSTTANNAFRASTFYSGGWITNYYADLMSFIEGYTLETTWHHLNVNDGWLKIKNEINNENPLIVLTDRNGTYGHYFVVVGYREAGTDRTLIVYDPFGRWLGVDTLTNNYDRNEIDPNSRKGQWAYYDYYKIWGYLGGLGRVMTIHTVGTRQQSLTPFTGTPSTLPDVISIEPENIGSYEGVNAGAEIGVYLPVIANQ